VQISNPCCSEVPTLRYLHFIALGVTLLFPWSFIFALPPLQMGIWINTEGVAFGIATLGCIAFLLLLAIGWQESIFPSHVMTKRLKNQKDIIRQSIHSLYLHISQAHPLLLGVGGLAFLSLSMLPMAYHDRLSWFGHPEQMVGGWFWLSITGIILCHLWLRRQPQAHTFNKAIRLSAGLACCAQLALVAFAHPLYAPGASGEWSLYHFPSHLGWVAVSLILLSFREPGRIAMIARALAVGALLLSQNKTAMGGMALGVLLYAGVARYTLPKRQWGVLLLILLISPLLLMGIEYAAFSRGMLPTLSSRFMSWNVLLKDISQLSAGNFFTGMGWGQMSDSIIRQLNFLEESGGQGWEGIGRFDASSLNQTLDSFAAIGPVGAIFSILIALSPFLIGKACFIRKKSVLKGYAEKGLFFAACLTTTLLHHGWFMMLSVFPVFISSVMVFTPPNTQHLKKAEPLKSFGGTPHFFRGIVMGAFALTLLWTSRSIYSTAVFYSSDLKHSLPVRLANKMRGEPLLTCENLVKYQGSGAINLAFWLKAYRSSQKRFPNEDRKNIENEIKCALRIVYQRSPSPSLTLLEYRKAFLPLG